MGPQLTRACTCTNTRTRTCIQTSLIELQWDVIDSNGSELDAESSRVCVSLASTCRSPVADVTMWAADCRPGAQGSLGCCPVPIVCSRRLDVCAFSMFGNDTGVLVKLALWLFCMSWRAGDVHLRHWSVNTVGENRLVWRTELCGQGLISLLGLHRMKLVVVAAVAFDVTILNLIVMLRCCQFGRPFVRSELSLSFHEMLNRLD